MQKWRVTTGEWRESRVSGERLADKRDGSRQLWSLPADVGGLLVRWPVETGKRELGSRTRKRMTESLRRPSLQCACLREAGATKILCGGVGDFGIDFGVFLLAEAFQIAERPTLAE